MSFYLLSRKDEVFKTELPSPHPYWSTFSKKYPYWSLTAHFARIPNQIINRLIPFFHCSHQFPIFSLLMSHFSSFFRFISKVLPSALGSKCFWKKQNPMRHRQMTKKNRFLDFGCALGSKFSPVFSIFLHFGPVLGPFSWLFKRLKRRLTMFVIHPKISFLRWW